MLIVWKETETGKVWLVISEGSKSVKGLETGNAWVKEGHFDISGQTVVSSSTINLNLLSVWSRSFYVEFDLLPIKAC